MPANTTRGYTYPLYTDQADFPAQLQDLATDVDTDMDALFDRLTAGYNMAACYVRASGVNQAIAVSTDVTATYDTELYDNQGMVNLGVSNTTINFVQTGIYLASGRATFLSNGNATINGRQISLVTTGSLGTVARKSFEGAQNTASIVTCQALFFASSGDTMTMVQRQNSGASLNSSTRSLMVARMGAL